MPNIVPRFILVFLTAGWLLGSDYTAARADPRKAAVWPLDLLVYGATVANPRDSSNRSAYVRDIERAHQEWTGRQGVVRDVQELLGLVGPDPEPTVPFAPWEDQPEIDEIAFGIDDTDEAVMQAIQSFAAAYEAAVQARIAELARSDPGWRCMVGVARPSGDVSIISHLRPWTLVDGRQAWHLTMMVVDVALKLETHEGREIPATAFDRAAFHEPATADAQAVARAAEEAITEISRRYKPCAFKLDFRGKMTGNVEGGRFDQNWAGAGMLALEQDGSFRASLPVSGTQTIQAYDCAGTGNAQGTLELAGRYADDEGLIRFTEMRQESTSGAVQLTCPEIGTISMALPGVLRGDIAEAPAIRLELGRDTHAESNVVLALGVTREIQLTLGYEGGGTRVAEAPEIVS